MVALNLFQRVVIIFLGSNFFVSSTSRQSFTCDNNVEYICVIGHNDTTIWAIWSDIEIVLQTKPEVLVDVFTGKRYRTNFCTVLDAVNVGKVALYIHAIVDWNNYDFFFHYLLKYI